MNKIVWICNKIPSSIAQKVGISTSPLGGWLDLLPVELVKEGYQIVIISPSYVSKSFQDDNLSFYSFLENNSESDIKKLIKDILVREAPDIIHIWGTEFKHTYYTIEIAEELGLLNSCIISIQGLVSIIGKYHFDDGLTSRVKYGFSIHDLIKRKNVILQKSDFLQRGKYEVESIRKVKHIIGRTKWDKSIVELLNPSVRYHACNETLRESFYSEEWNINKINRHSIFVSQSNYPLKGFHYMLQALPYILDFYPDAVLYTTGYDLINMNLHDRLRVSYYQLYLRNLIMKNHLENNVKFLGVLDEKRMLEQYLISHVFVSPSTIENSSNSIGEAMILGCPVVASNVGGTDSILKEDIEGFLYPFNEPYMMANYVNRLFSSDELCLEISKNARKRAMTTHNKETIKTELIKIYEDVFYENN